MDSRALGGWGLVLLGTVDGVYLDAVLVPRLVEVAPVAAPLSAPPAPPPARATIPPPPPPDADANDVVKEAASPNAWKAGFQTGSAELDSQHDLDGAVVAWRSRPDAVLEVVGHADRRGDEPTNRALSRARALAVASFLVASGVPRAAVRVDFRGAGAPADPRHSDEAYARNRRVDVTLAGGAR